MSHCRTSIVRLCAQRAELLGLDVAALLSKHGVEASCLAEHDRRLPFPLLVDLLALLERGPNGSRALEQFGAEVSSAHPLFRLLHLLHFGLPEVLHIAADRLLLAECEGVVQTVVRRQADGAFRVTVSLVEEFTNPYPFWTFLLGRWRTLPRPWGLFEATIEVEMADRFAEYLIILPPQTSFDRSVGREIRRTCRETLLAELIAHEQLLSLPKPELRPGLFEHRSSASEQVDSAGGPLAAVSAMEELKAEIAVSLQICRLNLFELTQAGPRWIASQGGPILGARLRRVLWISETPVGVIEVERPGDEGHARVASLLDEHIERFAYRFAEILHRLPGSPIGGGFTLAEPVVRDASLADAPPPSSRGRVARAARDGRLRELSEQWQLTERQREVLALVVEGFANKEIAARLSCSVGTIENHMTRLLKRGAVDGRAALTALFWRTSVVTAARQS